MHSAHNPHFLQIATAGTGEKPRQVTWTLRGDLRDVESLGHNRARNALASSDGPTWTLAWEYCSAGVGATGVPGILASVRRARRNRGVALDAIPQKKELQ